MSPVSVIGPIDGYRDQSGDVIISAHLSDGDIIRRVGLDATVEAGYAAMRAELIADGVTP